MSGKKYKSQASSSRAAASTFGSFGGFSSAFSSQGREPSSLTYVTEPPDLSRISEAQLTIAFKNFLKKDEVTRTKALEDLRDYVLAVESRGGTLDDGFLEAWVRIYPRASIDLSRRVRQTAHSSQGSIASLVGKRIARFLPKVIGAWLAGLYDNDRPVHRAALESFTRVFSTDEKRSGVWKIYQSSILDFVDDVILQQTPQTLSDERTVKADDAAAKYARVAATAILLFNRILGNSAQEDLEKASPTIETLLGSKSLWALSYHDDPFVRRSLYILTRTAVSKQPEELDWKLISAALIGKSLHCSQLGSASELSETILHVTSARPQLWTEDYSGKSLSSKRLLQYLQKGSQGGASSFWTNVHQLLQIIPLRTLAQVESKPTDENNLGVTSALALTESFHGGLISRDEPRQNRAVGWKAYIETVMWLLSRLGQDDGLTLLRQRLRPLIVQYVKPELDQTQWALPTQSAGNICTDALFALTMHGYKHVLEQIWGELSDSLLEAVKLSSPEQSKDFKSSQDAVCAQAERFLALEASLLVRVKETDRENEVSDVFNRSNLPLLDSCLEVLRSRNGKPYGAAAVAEQIVLRVAPIAKTSHSLLSFVQDDAPELLSSPSADRLISIILSCRSWDGFGSSFEKVLERVAQFDPETSNAHTVQKLLSTLDFQELEDKSGLISLIMRAVNRACDGSDLHWSIVIAVLQNETSHGGVTDTIFLAVIDALSDENKVVETLQGLSQVARAVPQAFQSFQNGPHGSKLTSKLLFLSESSAEDVASIAESLAQTLKESIISETSASKSSFEILQHSFDNVNEQSLSIESLVTIAEELLQNTKAEEIGRVAKDILPSRESWQNALGPFLELPPRPSTAITSPIGGAVHLVNRTLSDTLPQRYDSLPRDSNNCSSAFRLAYFTIRVLSSFDLVKNLGMDELETLFYNIPLAVQLIDDDLSIENCNGICGISLPEQREEYLNIVNDGWKVISGWARSPEKGAAGVDATISLTLSAFWIDKLEGLESLAPIDLHVGVAFVKILGTTDSSNSTKSSSEVTQLCRDMRKANAIRSAAWVATLRHAILSNPAGTRLCNEFVADSTGLKPQDQSDEGLRKLVLLNLLLAGEQDVAASIPTQRLMFLIKHLTQCLQSEAVSLGLKAEILQTLVFVLPCIKEMYGSHWEDCLEILDATWRDTNGGDEALPVFLSSFRLFAKLQSIVEDDESNDDVKDAWSDRKSKLVNGLTSTLRKFDPSTTFDHPRDITVGLLCRFVKTIPIENLEDVSSVFSLLTAQSRAIQRAAYTLLHRYIPSVQEQVSFDVALSKSTVRLPDELVSLLLGAPTIDSINESYGDEKIWTELRSYLLSWKIVFDHFVNASLTVQENYVASIRENESLNPLLDLTFDFLQQSHGKMVDVSKFDIRSFEPDQSETAEKEIQWLLVHLYFLCLKNLANMTKGWWIDTKNRIKGPVEAWTEKYISPLVIEESLQGVTAWTLTQDPNEERALQVKISPKTAEIIASIPVDEDSPPVSLSISLPPAYPLQPALVVGRSRVLVDERKWRNWLTTIQGVIMFANGSMVDGLLAFRKNVQGALKGQSECAICYSVISTDMQTPNKKCATCKNTFHSVCLFRWFKSSNQSTCPLCRNNFVYV
ncbi:ubiquitin-protein ligase RKR1 [Aspergillus homomorphus CBS 101889]|uniref:E3 ubiquitin-protein ligase listerin n=1 Tax=Aspergillus homomorphus (strain CBS 101889) TaxID=1450537 RepID=A0A395IAK7_ASPHC|nr:hypothetical protein BO97DRAFT_382343 [Aspergillus homomorphus CBS 101889]RAL17076.1 hypothetical protein BO97DRAFT_382343 [Aspergillus homomorphus CBS 101889]